MRNANTSNSVSIYDVLRPHFDANYYYSEYDDILHVDDALDHYIQLGWREGRNPAPWFKIKDDVEKKEDPAAANEIPLYRYIVDNGIEAPEAICQKHGIDLSRLEGSFSAAEYAYFVKAQFRTKREAFRHFVLVGIPAILPLSLKLRFDADFYREYSQREAGWALSPFI
jgi:hypothetical protein